MSKYFADVSSAYVSDAFDKRGEELKGRRLANRQALMTIGDQYASNGVSLTVDDWARESQNLLGAGSWLTSTTPSQDAMANMLKQQNEKAKQVQEERRRSQFMADAQERKQMEQDALGYFVNGDDPVTTYEKLREQYGDNAKKVQPHLSTLANKAQMQAMLEGKQYAEMSINDISEFDKFKEAHPGLSKFHLDGAKKYAESVTNQRNAKIADIASQHGASGGFMANETDRETFRKKIKTLYPGVSDDVLRQNVDDAMAIAAGADQQVKKAKQDQEVAAGRLSDRQNYATNMTNLAKLDNEERDRKLKLSKMKVQEFEGGIASQGELAKQIADPKGAFKDLGPEAKQTLFADFKDRMFADPEAYIAAVKSGKKDDIARIRGASQPISLYRANAEKLSNIITGADNFTNIGEAVNSLASLGASVADLTNLGREVARNNAIAASGAGKSPATNRAEVERNMNARGGRDYQYAEGLRGQPSQDTSNADTAATAKLNSSMLLDGFVKNTAQYLKEVREAITANGKFAASPEEMKKIEFDLVMSRATAVAQGMGLPPEQISNTAAQLMSKVMSIAGSPMQINKYDSPADVLRNEMKRMRTGTYQPDGYYEGAQYPSVGNRPDWRSGAGF
jgi:hypothetical protein